MVEIDRKLIWCIAVVIVWIAASAARGFVSPEPKTPTQPVAQHLE